MCDTLVIVQPGRVWFAKNSDREADEPQALEWYPREAGLRGERACTWRLIPQVERTHAVVLSRPIQMWGAEMGFNEHGVVIGNEAVFTKQSVPKQGGLTGMDLLRLALERAASAEEAVAVIQALNAEFGQGGSCGYEDRAFRYFSTFLIADARGAFVLETAGRETAVERVTAGVRSISNGLTIADFARAHSDVVKTGVSACRLRRARSEQLGAGVTSARALAAVLRDHGATAWPDYEWHRGAMRAPCMHAGGLLAASQTTASLVVELTPERLSAWATATSAPCLGVFKPVTLAPLELGPTPGREPDGSLWWAHERLHRAVMKDPARLAPLFLAERDALEARAFSGEGDAQALWNEARAALGTWTERVRATSGADLRPWAARRYWAARRAV